MATRDDDDSTERNLVKSPAGHVEIDSRGRSVWKWARDVLDSTSVLLKRLENRDLALEPTQKLPIQRTANAKQAPGGKRAEQNLEIQGSRRERGGGFDPYNSG